METKDFVLGFVAGKAQGGGGGGSSDVERLTPTHVDWNNGMVGSSGTLNIGSQYSNWRSDIYELEPNGRYFTIAGTGRGNAFRAGIYTSDPTTVSSALIPVANQCNIDADSGPLYRIGGNRQISLYGFTDALVAPSSGKSYLVVTKSSANTDGVPSYAFKINV